MAELPTPRGPGDPPWVAVACREFVELVTEHLEGSLPEDVDRAVRAHLALCDPCVAYLDQLLRTAALLRSSTPPSLPPAARELLLDAFDRLPHDPAR